MKATEITTLLTQVLEKSDTVTFQKPIKGLHYTTRKPETVPAGTYTVLGPDEEDLKYMVISNEKTRVFYIVKKGDLK